MADNDSVQRPVRVSRTYGRAAPAESVPEDAPVVLTTLKPRARPAPVQDPEEEDGPFDNGLGTLSDWRTRLLQSDSEDDENATASKGPQAAGKGSNQAGARLSPPAPSHASTVAGVVASSPADDSNLEQPSFDSSMNISMSSSRSANQALTTPPTSPGSSPVHLPPSALGKPLLLRDITPDEDRPFAARATQQANKVSKANKTARVKQASSASSVLPTKLKKPTKKEVEETKRETARILSDQRVHLPRPEKESKLSLSDLAAKLSNKWSQKSMAPPAPSSPIDRFSSSSALDEPDNGPSASRGGMSKHAPRVLDKAALQDAAKPLFGRTVKKSTTVNSADLNKTLLTRARHEAAAAREHKKQDWVSRGGTLKATEVDRVKVPAAPSQLRANYDEDEDAADGDWQPQGRDEAEADADASGSERGGTPGIGSGDEDEDDGEPIPDTQPVDMDEGDTEEDDEPVAHPRLPRRIPLQRAGRVIDSDSEDDDRPQSHILVPDTSFVLPPNMPGIERSGTYSDAVSASESEMGKENSEYRKYDDGDLKENAAPARLLVPELSLGAEDDKENPHQAQSSATRPAPLDVDTVSTDEGEQATEAFEDKENQPTRRPLSVLSRRHSSYVTAAGRSTLGPARTAQRSMQPLGELEHESDTDEDDGPHSPARAGKYLSHMSLNDDDFGGSSGLTQLFNDEPTPPSRPLLGRSKTEFFPSRRLFSDAIDSPTGISFTPTQRQRSRSRITESQRLKDDELLALDNEEPLTQFAASSASKGEEWFVGEDGLMTQTRPTFTPLPASSQTLFGPSLDPSPFGRDFASPGSLLESPIAANQPLRRLKRKSDAEEPEELVGNIPGLDEFFSPSRPAKKQRNAFEVLREPKPVKVKKERQKSAIASEFVEDQANESDEEAGFGFGRGDDETFDEEEMRAAVEGMTDDKTMDVDELAEDRIMEKHQEHLRADDEKIQALHERATRGDLRKKKRDGLQFDDDSSDDEHKTKRPRPQKGARNIENDTLPDLAKHAETLAFFNAYHSSTADDEKIELQDATFGASSDVEDVDMVDEPRDEEEDENENDGSVAKAAGSDDDDGGARAAPMRRRPMAQRQMQEELREAARKKESFGLNVDDATWVDQDDDDTDLEVEEVSVKDTARGARTTNFDRDVIAPKAQIATGQAAKLADWAKQENRRTGGSSARTGGKGSAVTGHPSRTASAAANAASGSNDRRRRASAPQGSKGTGLNKFLSAARSRA